MKVAGGRYKTSKKGLFLMQQKMLQNAVLQVVEGPKSLHV